jgi:hypothetical protein
MAIEVSTAPKADLVWTEIPILPRQYYYAKYDVLYLLVLEIQHL